MITARVKAERRAAERQMLSRGGYWCFVRCDWGTALDDCDWSFAIAVASTCLPSAESRPRFVLR